MSTSQRKLLNRLNRAQGQLNAVIRAVEEGKPCQEIVTQLSAVTGALNRAGYQIVVTAMKDCLSEPADDTDGSGRMTEQQLEKLFLSLS